MAKPTDKKRLATPESILSTLAIGCSLLVLLLLGARQFTSTDIGYHLSFGETFFESGTIVDHTPFIYNTLPQLESPGANLPEPGPGSWYDNRGQYHFINTSWLSQPFIYGFWRLSNNFGLNLLQILIIAGLFVLLMLAMRKSPLPSYLIAPALLLMGLIINSRFNMRPELFGYLCLVVQYLMLVRLSIQTDKPLPPSWFWVVGMVVVQLLLINFHSYYILGLAITGAVLTEYFLYALKKRFADKDFPRFQAYKKVVRRLGMTLMGMALVCFVNPWGWRLVWHPFETLLYMKKYNIGGPDPGKNPHPWAHILELKSTITKHWLVRISDYAIMIILVLAAAALLFQLAVLLLRLYQKSSRGKSSSPHQVAYRVRWAHLFMIAGMLFVGLQMRRNIGVASLIIVPSALICISESLQYFLTNKLEGIRRKFTILANVAVLLLALYGGYQIINGKLYEADYIPTRFGFGISSTMLPIGAASWLSKYAPDARVWCDFSSSSTVHFFSHPHKDVNILTNTWAYPPAVMAANRFYREAKTSFNPLADRYHIDAVVLRTDWSLPLHRQLGADPGWKIVHVAGVHVLYLRANDKFRTLADKYEIKPNNLDMDSFVAQQLRQDSSFKRAILAVSDTFINAGELDLAINVIETGLKYQPPNMIIIKKLQRLYDFRKSLSHKTSIEGDINENNE
jgi:hypothetical protein